LRPVGIAAGLHVYTWLPDDLPEGRVITAARNRGVLIGGVGEYQLGADPRGGLIFGYGKLPELMIRRGVKTIRKSLEDVRGTRGSERLVP
jgi:GntR family transcriptional regulator/MocR family aminotransferase